MSLSIQEQRLARFRPITLILLFCFVLQLFPAPLFAEPLPQRATPVRHFTPKFDDNGHLINESISPHDYIPKLPDLSNPIAWGKDPSVEQTPGPKSNSWFQQSDSSTVELKEEDSSPKTSDPSSPRRYPVRIPQSKNPEQQGNSENQRDSVSSDSATKGEGSRSNESSKSKNSKSDDPNVKGSDPPRKDSSKTSNSNSNSGSGNQIS